ncbi:MAG TPA: ArsA-related P-loop ATPase [Solirubrobacteraceae bacterium]|nr:ArsA-related P-loop ATPase [Solirubrobacteraceae bacterium]
MNAPSPTLADLRIVVCAGAGGVGKTTVSAAVAVGLAASGRRVAAVTIDPARRLAEALGLEDLRNQPQLVEASRLRGSGLLVSGELSAMMLDVKRTFDELIELLAPDADTAQAILTNPIYQHLSTAVAGSQEYTAMAKLFELAEAGTYDVIVLDTPPSRSAANFLDAPERLTALLQSRALTALLGPTRTAAKAAEVAFAGLRRITGVGLLEDLTVFFQLIAQLLEGFRKRAVRVEELLREPTTGFLIVTSTDHAPVAEAIRFGRELDRMGMSRAGVIVNRVQPLDASNRPRAATKERLAPRIGVDLAEKVACTHAELQTLARRDRDAIRALSTALPGPGHASLVDRDSDVRDLRMLAGLARELFDGLV